MKKGERERRPESDVNQARALNEKHRYAPTKEQSESVDLLAREVLSNLGVMLPESTASHEMRQN